jgi:hypothetical protein
VTLAHPGEPTDVMGKAKQVGIPVVVLTSGFTLPARSRPSTSLTGPTFVDETNIDSIAKFASAGTG